MPILSSKVKGPLTRPAMEMHACQLGIQETEAGESGSGLTCTVNTSSLASFAVF